MYTRRHVAERIAIRRHVCQGWRVPRRVAVRPSTEGPLQLLRGRRNHPAGRDLRRPIPASDGDVDVERREVELHARRIELAERQRLLGKAPSEHQVVRRLGLHFKGRRRHIQRRPHGQLHDLELHQQGRGRWRSWREVHLQDPVEPRRAQHPACLDPSGVDLRHDCRQGRGPLRVGQGQHLCRDRGAPRREGKPSAGPDVGQAVAMAINKDESAKVTYGDSAKTQKYMAGFSDNLVPQWLSSADLGKLNAYAYDVTKAAGLMTAAGYAKGSDGVYAKDGKKLEFEMYSPSDFADWSSAADHAQKALNTFGIKIVPRSAIRSQQLPDVNAGNFQIAIMAWGIGNPHPQGSFIQDLRTHNTIPAGGGMKYPLKQGNTDFDALIVKMSDGFDTNAQKPAVTEAVLAFNDLLPVIPLWERYGNNPVNDKKRVAGWKPDSDPVYKNPWSTDAFTTLMIMDGTLHKI